MRGEFPYQGFRDLIVDECKLSLSSFHCFEIIRNGLPLGKRVVPLLATAPEAVMQAILQRNTLSGHLGDGALVIVRFGGTPAFRRLVTSEAVSN